MAFLLDVSRDRGSNFTLIYYKKQVSAIVASRVVTPWPSALL